MSPRRNGLSAMNRRSLRVWCRNLGVAATALTLGMVGCGRWKATDALNALQIVQVQILEAGGDCTVPGTPTSTTRTAGTLDVYLPDNSFPPYGLPVVVANNLATSGGGSPAEEMNNITLTHFSVELSAPGMTWDSSCPAAFDSETFTTFLAPGGSAGHVVAIITSHHAQCLLAALSPQRGDPAPRHVLVTAKVTAKGHHGGTSIESAPFVFPVDVCTGCLQTNLSAALQDFEYPADIPSCSELVGDNAFKGDPCFGPGQDETFFCCAIKKKINGTEVDAFSCPGSFTGKEIPDAGP
jgi:hypothetical protein